MYHWLYLTSPYVKCDVTKNLCLVEIYTETESRASLISHIILLTLHIILNDVISFFI